jgi:hypothetical protein
LTSGWFSGCKLFLFVHSYIFLTCSNPGLASLSCIVKIKHPRHSTTRLNCSQFLNSQLYMSGC